MNKYSVTKYFFIICFENYYLDLGIQRGAHPARAPPKIGKNMIFFTRNTPQI